MKRALVPSGRMAVMARTLSRMIPKRSDLPPEELSQIPHVCASLEEALGELDSQRAFLTKGGVFSDDMIDAYIELKMDEVTRLRMTTHPIEFDMYYSI